MNRLTPTLVICAGAAAVVVPMLAAPAERPDSAPSAAAPTDDASSSATSPAGGVELLVEGFAFAPVSVAAGATVTVVNRDGDAHTVTASDATFDAFVPGGGSASFAAPATAGTYSFVCDIHPSMSGRLTVT